MNIDKVLVASNKRFEIMSKVQKSETVNNWVLGATLATWLGTIASESITPSGTATIVVGSAFITSAAAFAALLVQKGLRKKSIRNLENAIVQEGRNKEKREGAQLNATQKRNTTVRWAYTVGGIAAAAVGYQVIESVVPSLGVAWMKAALIVSTSLTSYKLGSKAATTAFDAGVQRSALTQRIAKRHGVDVNTTTEPKLATLKFK